MAKCAYCGKHGEGQQTYSGEELPRGWVRVKKNFFLAWYFCSIKCKEDGGK